MFATDFLFDGQRASDFGLMICSFNGDFETASGGEVEYNVVKTSNNDKFSFYGAQLNSVIVWNFSICKNPRTNKNMYFNQYEESYISKWLLKLDGYKSLQFEQEGSEDIFYNAYFNLSPQQVGGQTVGFNLTATTDCAYGFTRTIIKCGSINFTKKMYVNTHCDLNTYILPHVKISKKVNNINDFYIKNENDTSNTQTEFYNMKDRTNVEMDSETDIISGITPSDFNWYFLRLLDGQNIITTDSKNDIEIEFQYREPRRVIL